MWCQVPYDSSQEANDTHWDSKTGPAIPVVGGRHQSKQDFPEDSHKMTRVVQARRCLLHTVVVPTIIIVIVSWVGKQKERGDEMAGPFGVGKWLAKGGVASYRSWQWWPPWIAPSNCWFQWPAPGWSSSGSCQQHSATENTAPSEMTRETYCPWWRSCRPAILKWNTCISSECLLSGSWCLVWKPVSDINQRTLSQYKFIQGVCTCDNRQTHPSICVHLIIFDKICVFLYNLWLFATS